VSESEQQKEEPVAATPTEEQEVETAEGTTTETEAVTAEPVEEAVEEKAAEPEPTEEKEGEEGEEEGEEIEVVEERLYTIPLRHAWVVTPRGQRAPRAARDVRNFVARHMKAEEVAISNEVNEVLWQRGINKPPRKIKIRAVKDKEGKVVVYSPKAA
jgi:large subunit ribosomal protein L31e